MDQRRSKDRGEIRGYCHLSLESRNRRRSLSKYTELERPLAKPLLFGAVAVEGERWVDSLGAYLLDEGLWFQYRPDSRVD